MGSEQASGSEDRLSALLITHSFTIETRNNSLTLFEGLANAIIASGYLRGFGKYPGATEPSNDARWLPGEEGLHVRVDIKLWLQRLRDHHRLQVQLRKMNEYVSNLRESLLTVRSCPEPVRDVFKETINISYLQELLEEVVEALDAEGKLCEQILRQTGQTTTYKSQVVYSSAWAARPLLHDHRQRALKDLLELVLQDKKGV